MKDVAERVKKLIVEQLAVDPHKVVPSASFIDDLDADSLDQVEIMMNMEQEFGCEISDDDAASILTVGDAIRFLEKHAAT
jgi:acyl carrier protein